MLDKTKKIIYIIVGTLTIICLVFSLMKKVGLCASVSPTTYVSDFPLPFGAGSGFGYGDFPLTSEIVSGAISEALSRQPSYFSNGYSVLISEVDTQNNVIIFNVCGGNALYSLSDTLFQNRPTISIPRKGTVRIKYDNGSYSSPYQGNYAGYYQVSLSNALSALPNGTGYYLPQYTFISNYPVAFSEGYDLTFGDILIFGNPPEDTSGHPLGGGSGTITNLPNLEDLTGSPSPDDSNDSLFSLLKGWLSTINGNIKKGFINIYDNISSFLQPYLERFKSVTDIIQNPEDFLFCSKERQTELLESSQTYQDIQSLHGIGNSIFGIIGAQASDHVYWEFDFSNTVLDPVGSIRINFDWYNSIRDKVVPLFLAFFYVGMLLLIIRKIPGIISGASSNSDDK